MSDDALISGAAAPVGQRWIRSTAVLDAGWVVVSSVALIVSSFATLIDLPDAELRTGAEPLRVFPLGLPGVAIAIAVVGAVRRSVTAVAVASGVLVPSIALAGSLGVSLLLSDDAAFADVGVAVSIGAALVGLTLLIRWFVYHPLPLIGDQSRPVPVAGYAVLGLGVMSAMVLLVTTIAGDTSWNVASVAQTMVLLVTAGVVVAAGITRTVPAVLLACAACVAQVVAVSVVKVEQSSVAYDSDLVLRTGVVGLVLLVVTAVVCAIAAMRVAIDPVSLDDADDEPWRWHLDA